MDRFSPIWGQKFICSVLGICSKGFSEVLQDSRILERSKTDKIEYLQKGPNSPKMLHYYHKIYPQKLVSFIPPKVFWTFCTKMGHKLNVSEKNWTVSQIRIVVPKFGSKTLYALILKFTPRNFKTLLVNKHGSGECFRKTPTGPKMGHFYPNLAPKSSIIYSRNLL